jgi:hypothetical protein
MGTETTTIVYDLSMCHWECQESSTCQTFSFDDTAYTCILYDKACTVSASGVPNNNNYGKKWFKEVGFTTVDFCTHLSYFDHDVAKVAACKAHTLTGKSACNSEGTNGICYYKLYDHTVCNTPTSYLIETD